jgi:hypothetical protein
MISVNDYHSIIDGVIRAFTMDLYGGINLRLFFFLLLFILALCIFRLCLLDFFLYFNGSRFRDKRGGGKFL